MKSLTTPNFWDAYAALPSGIKKQARKAYGLWKENQSHPSLHFKKVDNDIWSARITNDYRALAYKENNDYYWFWIGLHDEYDRLLK